MTTNIKYLIEYGYSDEEILNHLQSGTSDTSYSVEDRQFSDYGMAIESEFSAYYESNFSSYDLDDEDHVIDAFNDFLDSQYAEDSEYAAPLLLGLGKVAGSVAGRSVIGAGVGAAAGGLTGKDGARRRVLQSRAKSGNISESEKQELKRLKSGRVKRILTGAVLGAGAGAASKAVQKKATKTYRGISKGFKQSKGVDSLAETAANARSKAKLKTKELGAENTVMERAAGARRHKEAREAAERLQDLKGANKVGAKLHGAVKSTGAGLSKAQKIAGAAMGIAGTASMINRTKDTAKELVKPQDEDNDEE